MNRHRILVAEDEAHIRSGLVETLEMEGFLVQSAADGHETLLRYNEFRPDLILLDVMMPRHSGYEVCRQIRRGDAATPIIFLTAKGEEIDKILGLELGADDYVTKPFSLRELIARIRARLRAVEAKDTDTAVPECFTAGEWQIDSKRLSAAAANGDAVELSVREVALLRLLASRPLEVLPREAIMRQLWGVSGNASRTLDQHIAVLRRKLEFPPHRSLIETVYGVGYRLARTK